MSKQCNWPSTAVWILGFSGPQCHVVHGLLIDEAIVNVFLPVLILMEAASAARTVSLTLSIRFCALPTNISVASWSSSDPGEKAQSEREITISVELSKIVTLVGTKERTVFRRRILFLVACTVSVRPSVGPSVGPTLLFCVFKHIQ